MSDPPMAKTHTGCRKKETCVTQGDHAGYHQPTPGRVSGKHDLCVRALEQPADCGNGVIDGCRKRELRRTTIVNR